MALRSPSMTTEELIAKVEEMLDCRRYQYARDALEGILDTCVTREFCTQKMIDAVLNIETGGDR